jgi:uncharacterized delta-60 repeat protein
MHGAISPRFAAALAAVLFSVTSFFAQPGTLDPTFNGSGVQVFNPGGNGASQKGGVIQSDGMAVSLVDDQLSGALLIRVKTDGTLDTAFGMGGIVTSDWHYSPTLPRGFPYGMAIQMVNGEERFVVAGSWTVPQGKRSAVNMLRVDRYLPDGRPDTSFGPDGTGRVILNKPYALAVAIQSDNKIVTVGDLEGVVRLNEDGTVDNAFGNRGDGTTGAGQSGWAITVLPTGRILVAGSYAANSSTLMCVSALNPNGSVAEDFGNQGRAIADFYGRGSFGRAFDLAIDPSGNIVAGGIARPKGASLAENVYAGARFTSNGQLDTSFSRDGKVTFSFFGLNNSGRNVAIQSDGKIILGGSTNVATNITDFAMVRFNPDGTVDSTFGSDGRVTTDTGGTSEYSENIRVWNDPACGGCEKIVLFGGGNAGSSFARYFAQ